MKVGETRWEQRQLPNGIRFQALYDDRPQTQVVVQVPVGTAHSTGRIGPGTLHFLEHMLGIRCRRHPQAREFHRLLESQGGRISAATGPVLTSYELTVPKDRLESVLPGFFSRIFEPLFDETDISLERGIVANERCLKAPWFPAASELGQYLCTKWMWDCPTSLRQRFGNDEDLIAITPESLEEAHRYYFDRRVTVMMSGPGDARPLLDPLSSLAVAEHDLPREYQPMRWARKEYHELPFRETGCFHLHYGGISPRPDMFTILALQLIIRYLSRPLLEWLRHEKGWVYTVDTRHGLNDEAFNWILNFPLGNREQVRLVREELNDRIVAAIADKDAIAGDLEGLCRRALGADWYPYQRMVQEGQASSSAGSGETSEAEILEYTKRLTGLDFLQQVWREHSAPERTGWFCAVPLGA